GMWRSMSVVAMFVLILLICFFFFFQAEDGIRDWSVTGVQTCALPICKSLAVRSFSSSVITSDLRSAPIITLSLASSNSICVTMRLLRRAAIKAASLTRFMRSAPEKPGVPRAVVLRLTSGATGTLRTWTLNLLAADHVRIGHDHLAVEAAWPQQRRVEHVGTVGRGDQDDALVRLEAVHLDQQLIERLLALVVAAAETGTAMATHRVDLV